MPRSSRARYLLGATDAVLATNGFRFPEARTIPGTAGNGSWTELATLLTA